MNQEKVTSILSDGTVKEVVDKVQEFANTEKGKEMIETIKEKGDRIRPGKKSKKTEKVNTGS